MAAGQLPPVWLVWWIGEQSGDDYGIGFNSLGMACVLIFAPLVLPVLGLLQAVLHALPALHLARFTAARARGPIWGWYVVCGVLLGVAWAVLAAGLWDWSFTVMAPLLAALGTLPVLGAAWVARRARWGFWRTWLGSGLASMVLFVLVGLGGVLASVTGLLKEYEPPKLSAGQLTGVWRGEDGAVLRLDSGGRAELAELPTVSDSDDWTVEPPFAVCEGTGTWELVREDEDEGVDRDGVGLRVGSGCGQPTLWTIGGTEREPELFVLFGDPDAGDLRILRKEPQRPS
ncbi:hypothetical protein H4N64_24145 [Streptomyces sp. PSKA01]|uniref:Uncharacterized protein n=1 Tax=Streptomyces cupreus TaxID=2759956 RepID=A0A7X1MAS8_9ACTN|nr:hypothetical protein [Streptomyces cupreus]